jgi:hypothetical protein
MVIPPVVGFFKSSFNAAIDPHLVLVPHVWPVNRMTMTCRSDLTRPSIGLQPTTVGDMMRRRG